MQGNQNSDPDRNLAPNRRSRNHSVTNSTEHSDYSGQSFSQSQGSNFWNDNRNRYADPPYPNDQRLNHQFNNAQFHPYNGSENYHLPPPYSGYRGAHYDPQYKQKKGSKTSYRATQQQQPAKKKVEVVDYKLRLDHVKTWAKYDSSDFTKQATIPASESDWKQFLEPFQVLIAQNMLVLAGDSLKIEQKAAKNKGMETVLSDSEFKAQLEVATGFLKIAKPAAKLVESTPAMAPIEPE